LLCRRRSASNALQPGFDLRWSWALPGNARPVCRRGRYRLRVKIDCCRPEVNVVLLQGDKWDGSQCEQWEIPNATFADIRDALLGLFRD
jgi:hypothetical protein